MNSPQNGAKRPADRFIPFFPDYLLDEVIAWYVVLGVLIVLASLFPAGLEAQADPLSTPTHIKPEWYFLFLYQSLKLVPRIVGVLAPGIIVLALLFLPFLDRHPDRSIRARVAPVLIGIAIVVVVIALTIWGWLS
jgi:quinol-cytochrome oxidoreductase complex cytochrome b subunit